MLINDCTSQSGSRSEMKTPFPNDSHLLLHSTKNCRLSPASKYAWTDKIHLPFADEEPDSEASNKTPISPSKEQRKVRFSCNLVTKCQTFDPCDSPRSLKSSNAGHESKWQAASRTPDKYMVAPRATATRDLSLKPAVGHAPSQPRSPTKKWPVVVTNPSAASRRTKGYTPPFSPVKLPHRKPSLESPEAVPQLPLFPPPSPKISKMRLASKVSPSSPRSPGSKIAWMEDPGLGKSKVFTARLDRAATTIQSKVRVVLAQCYILKLKKEKAEKAQRELQAASATMIQRRARAFLSRSYVEKMRGALLLQRVMRGFLLRRRVRMTRAATRIQAYFRGWYSRMCLRKEQLEKKIAEVEEMKRSDLLFIRKAKEVALQQIQERASLPIQQEDIEDVQLTKQAQRQVVVIDRLKEQNRSLRIENQVMAEAMEELLIENECLCNETAEMQKLSKKLKRAVKKLASDNAKWKKILKQFDQRKQEFEEAISQRQDYFEFEEKVHKMMRESTTAMVDAIAHKSKCPKLVAEIKAFQSAAQQNKIECV